MAHCLLGKPILRVGEHCQSRRKQVLSPRTLYMAWFMRPHKDEAARFQPCWSIPRSSPILHSRCETVWLEVSPDLCPTMRCPVLGKAENYTHQSVNSSCPVWSNACGLFAWLYFGLPLKSLFWTVHLMSFYGCWVTFEWVDGHPGQWRGFRPLPFSSFVVHNVFCLTLFLWTAVLEIWRMEETWHSLYPSAIKALLFLTQYFSFDMVNIFF